MTPSIWNDLDHRLSVIPRWPLAVTLHKQSVAEHVFNVERMALRIARDWFNISDPIYLYSVAIMAQHHDDFEALSSDLPTMVKPYFDSKRFEEDHRDLFGSLPFAAGVEAKGIVKLADMFDGLWFLAVEHSLGNQYIAPHIEHEPGRIRQFVATTWHDNPRLEGYVNFTMHNMFQERSMRHSKRGR